MSVMMANMAGKFERPEDLSGEVRAGVVDLLYRLADDELIIGHRNSEWTGLGPILEEDIAFSSMAQDEMGHALAYYTLLQQLGERDPDSQVFGRESAEFRCCGFVALGASAFEGARDASWAEVGNSEFRITNSKGTDGNAERRTLTDERKSQSDESRVASNELEGRRVGGDWAFSLVRQYLYDAAEHERLGALCESSYRPVAGLARKLIAEEKYHMMHGGMWMAKLGAATEESHRRLQEALTAAMPYALGMFEPTRFDALLAETGVCRAESDLRERWLEMIRRELANAGLEVGATLPEAIYGGRAGKHSAELRELVEGMQKVNRLAPGASW